ncbi:type II toxin-antitoxin system RelE family toxin [Pasteurella multocida]|uniref:type II toxin-antitoxin system RelE family toxin n=1 Tax=Pasteurella multocida TaxID=747 RepID=UPI0014801070|nr:type II toxin-antitoxin system RelE/ParE family toxin [Pasteurella multocida]NNH97781.1 type II toxin-antitoxin system RelE/ParE family toxin [Pasteurella multocida]NNI42919.1 type II toxin-antitoxin system RelE/ParE family toxin [Pasteurella multocida]
MKYQWNLKYAESALKQLKKLSKKNPKLVEMILNYLDETAKLDDPRSRGKALTSNFAGFWRYRVGDFRIICAIDNGELVITAVNIDHRSKVYNIKK